MILPKCHLLILLFLTTFLALTDMTWATFGYYKIFTPYGTGDTILSTWEAHQGANQADRKWIVECMDGEAMVGILGNGDDYTRLWYVWCKFMFPYKPPSHGAYPYYPSCHVRNLTTQYFCYHAAEHERTVNTFVTGFWGNSWNFILNRLTLDNVAPYKCCKTPHGYYLDYTSCYYQPTHDPYWEYYDTGIAGYFTVYCQTGYVMTGITKRINPYTKPDYHVDWIQCCRVGFGVAPHEPPPSNNTINQPIAGYGNYQNVKAYNYARARMPGHISNNNRAIVEVARNKMHFEEPEDSDTDMEGEWQEIAVPQLDSNSFNRNITSGPVK